MGATGPIGPQGPKGDQGEPGNRILTGYIRADGSVQAGTGFTVTHIPGSSFYTVNWAPGTFPAGSTAIPSVQSVGIHSFLNYSSTPDGAGSFMITTNGIEGAFWFYVIEVR